MPVIIRIIFQRIFAVLLSVLAFFGISPQINIPTTEETKIIEEQRDQDIKNFIDHINQDNDSKTNPTTPTTKQEPVVQNPVTVPQIIDEAQKIVEENFGLTLSETEDTVVNIICLHKYKNKIEAHAGSGVIIDPRGVVITNAHVAQFFLLESEDNPDYMNCALYEENIPTYGYKAKLLYLSASWVQENYTLIRTSNPKGTGEGDYAFLYIVGNTNPALKKPNEFVYANFNDDYKYNVGSKIIAVGYPGAPSNITALNRSVALQSDESYISEVFTLEEETIDVISTGPTIVAQKGSSGGGIFSAKSKDLIGITVTVTEDVQGKKINAITTNYINRHLSNKEGYDVDDLLTPDGFSNDLMTKVDNFYDKEAVDMRNLLLRVY